MANGLRWGAEKLQKAPLLSEATRKALGAQQMANGWRASRKAAKGAGKTAAEGLKLGYCPTLLAEAARKALSKRLADGQSRREAAKGAGKGAGKG